MSRVAFVQAGVVVRVTDGMGVAEIADYRAKLVARLPTSRDPRNEQAVIDDFDAHTLVDLAPGADVEIGDTYDGASFAMGAARAADLAAAQAEITDRSALQAEFAQLQAVATGTGTFANNTVRDAAIRLMASFLVFIIKAWFRRQL